MMIKERTQVVVLWTVVVVLLFAFTSVAERAPEALPKEGELTPHFQRMSTYHKRMDGSVPEGAVLFIGDSITQGLCVAAVCQHGVNYGIGSDTTAGVIERLPLYASVERAAAVVLAIGVNDLRRRDDQFIRENLRLLLEQITPHAPVVVSAILPLDERIASVGADRNKRIAGLNGEIKALADSFAHCVYVDAGPMLLDEEGCLAAACHVGDGVHPNTEGYAKWIAVLQAGLKKVRVSEACNK